MVAKTDKHPLRDRQGLFGDKSAQQGWGYGGESNDAALEQQRIISEIEADLLAITSSSDLGNTIARDMARDIIAQFGSNPARAREAVMTVANALNSIGTADPDSVAQALQSCAHILQPSTINAAVREQAGKREMEQQFGMANLPGGKGQQTAAGMEGMGLFSGLMTMAAAKDIAQMPQEAKAAATGLGGMLLASTKMEEQHLTLSDALDKGPTAGAGRKQQRDGMMLA